MMMNALLQRSSQLDLDQTQTQLDQTQRCASALCFYPPKSRLSEFLYSSLAFQGLFKVFLLVLWFYSPHPPPQHLFLSQLQSLASALKDQLLLGSFSAADRRMTSQPKWVTQPRGWEAAEPVRRRPRVP